MDVLRRLSLPERLAALAGLAAAIASLAGFIPGLYRDPPLVVAQSHGYDAANLVAVLVLALGLGASARGSLRGRLIAVGALGCLLYGYVTYAFLIVLNPVTPLYIAVLAFGGWSLATGLASFDDGELETTIGRKLRRRTTAIYLLIVAALFAFTWLGQIAGAVTSGQLPAELKSAGWPMNPVYVLDLGFVLPLMVLAAARLLTTRPGGVRLTIPLLVFQPLLALAIIAVGVAGAAAGQAFDPGLVTIFATLALVSTALAWLGLDPRPVRPATTTIAGRAHVGGA
ncbi:MAG: hypothetical protein ACXWOW_07345 [Candidatus Limnocylindrales bacterium]